MSKPNEPTHSDLVELGVRYAKRIGFAVVASELHTWGCREQADVVGFCLNSSILIEAKCSRSDFRADARKPERTAGGLGIYRFYLCPANLIQVEDVPERWGLLWVENRKVRMVKGPQGNIWPPYDPAYPYGNWSSFMHEPDLNAERAVMFSIARRRSLTRSEERYEAQLREANLRADRLARSHDELARQNRALSAELFALRAAGLSELAAIAHGR